MAHEPINVLHIDSGREWRGGQQQIAYLLQGLSGKHCPQSVICPSSSQLKKVCSNYHIPCISVPLRGEFDLKSAFAIASISRYFSVNVVHAHCAHSLALSQIARLFYHKPRLVASRRVDFSVYKKMIGAFKYSNPLVDQIVCVSGAIRDILIRDGIDPKRVQIVYSGVDLSKFSNALPLDRKQLDIPDHHTIIGTVAALADHKDYPTLLQAARHILNQRQDVTFLALGDGPDKKPLQELAKELELGSGFRFLGHYENVGSILKMFDIFVLASKTEGLGTSIIDAQAVGLPVVATRAGGIPELINHNKTGLLVTPCQPIQLANALLQLINDNGLSRLLAAQGQQTAGYFNWRRMTEETLNVYQNVLDTAY